MSSTSSLATLAKDEQYFDRFDQVFGSYFNGIEKIITLSPDIPPLEWLEKQLQCVLSDEEKAALQKSGGPEALQKRIEELLKEQKGMFKYLEHYYFHNCVYKNLWQSNRRRRDQVRVTQDIINKYGQTTN